MKTYIITWCIITLISHWSEPAKDEYGRITPLINDMTWSSENRTIIVDNIYDCNHKKYFDSRQKADEFMAIGIGQNDLANFKMDSINIKP